MAESEQSGHVATLFVTTGRCGTQWLARNLGEVYGDLAVVTHDPLSGMEYQARELMWRGDVEKLKNPGPILNHLRKIKSVLADKHYIETGGFCRGAFPYLIDNLGDRGRVVHLIRHPLTTARSYRKAAEGLKDEVRKSFTRNNSLNQLFSGGPPRSERQTWAARDGLGTLGHTPFDPGSRFHEYQTRWFGLTPLERELYRWLEINAAAVAYEKKARCPWLRAKYEELFSEEGMSRLLSFLQLPVRLMFFSRLETVIDKFAGAADAASECIDLQSHPSVLDLMLQLSYNR
jgi:hypothetical protein